MATQPITINPVDSWRIRLRGRVFSQFRSTNLDQISDIIAAQAQDLEDAWQQLLSVPSIDLSEGVQLQTLGLLVGQPYNGEDDATYRLRLRARIRANMSSGTGPDLYSVFLAMFGLSGTGQAEILTHPSAPASLVFVSGRPLYANEATVLFELLVAAKVAGVRLTLEWPTADLADSFAFYAAGKGFGGLVWPPDPDPRAWLLFGGAMGGSLSA